MTEKIVDLHPKATCTGAVKAYIATEPYEDRGGIYYAETDIEARRMLMNDYDLDELAGITCRRHPYLDDKRNDRREQTRYLLDDGWWFEDGQITADDQPFVSMAGEVYRNWMQWLGEREKRAIRRGAQRRAELDLWGKWPWAEDIRAHIEPSGKVDASIKLPFMQGNLRWIERENAHTVERRDLAVFRQAYTVNLDGEWHL